MNVGEALNAILNEESIIVGDKTFIPEGVDTVKLDSGETVYWVRDGGDIWLAIDPESEEVILFTDIEEDIDADSDVAVYAGDDYEFSYESEGKILDEGEEIDNVLLREFERKDGAVLRVTESEVGGEIRAAIGRKVPEDELQEMS